MKQGILRVSETAEADIEAVKAFVMVRAESEKLAFGNAAVTASEDLKAAIDNIQQVSQSVEIETESVSTQNSASMFGKNSVATYAVKLIVSEIDKLGSILGILSEGKKLSVTSVLWDYDKEAEKLRLIKDAMRKAKHKADEMMAVVDYQVVGIRSCSDSYRMPTVGESVLNTPSAVRSASSTLKRARQEAPTPTVDIGVQFKSKQKVSATCTVEFLVSPKA